jgi:endonuclease YncB( thermonuclease family)
LPISRSRRIFRSSLPLRWPALVALAGLAVMAGITLVTLPWLTSGSAAPNPRAGTDLLDAQPAQIAVVDGSTLRLGDLVVRLLGVDPPMRGAACRGRDGSDVDCGAAATNALAALVWGRPVACRVRGQDKLGRPYASCEAGGMDLGLAQVAAGWAHGNDALPMLKREEAQARVERRGIWAMVHDKP